jgi:hypothetical protein
MPLIMVVFRNSADDLMFNDCFSAKSFLLEDKLEVNESYWGTMLESAR